MISTHEGLETGAKHLDDVRMPHPRQLLPLNVELHLLGLSLKILDRDLPGALTGVMPHCPEDGAKAALAQQSSSLDLSEADLLKTVRGLLLNLLPPSIIVTIVW